LISYVLDTRHVRDVLIPIYNTDVSASLGNHDVNRRNADVSLSGRFRLFKSWHSVVRRFFSSASRALTVDNNSRNSENKVSKSQWNQTPFNRIHVTVDTTRWHEPDPVSSTSHHDPHHDPHISIEEHPCV
jgi:hypothetical protein